MLGESKTLAWGFVMAPHQLRALVSIFYHQLILSKLMRFLYLLDIRNALKARCACKFAQSCQSHSHMQHIEIDEYKGQKSRNLTPPGSRVCKFLVHRVRISEILPWDRKSYLTHAILPRLSSEGFIHWLYWILCIWSSNDVIINCYVKVTSSMCNCILAYSGTSGSSF